MATRMRFGPEALAALGLTAKDLTDGTDVAALLAFPDGTKVTSAKADGGDVVVNISGAKLADGTDASGEVTGAYTVHPPSQRRPKGRREFDGFRQVGAAEPETAAADTTAATTGQGA